MAVDGLVSQFQEQLVAGAAWSSDVLGPRTEQYDVEVPVDLLVQRVVEDVLEKTDTFPRAYFPSAQDNRT